jgi:lysophospholipase L1-like esterase
MAPVPVIQHGFGGAKLNDLVYYADRLVSGYRPRAVVVFAGSNDITPFGTKTPEILLASYREFVSKVRQQQPDLPIYYIAITPSPRRWEVWSIVQTTNAFIADFCATDDKLHFIDTGPALLDGEGEPDPSNYIFDKLHLSEKGYRIWTGIIRPRLLADMPEYAQ